jgi:hypothetical protein
MASDFQSRALQRRYGSHWMPSILAHQLGDPRQPPVHRGFRRPARAGLCGVYEIAQHYCPLL